MIRRWAPPISCWVRPRRSHGREDPVPVGNPSRRGTWCDVFGAGSPPTDLRRASTGPPCTPPPDGPAAPMGGHLPPPIHAFRSAHHRPQRLGERGVGRTRAAGAAVPSEAQGNGTGLTSLVPMSGRTSGAGLFVTSIKDDGLAHPRSAIMQQRRIAGDLRTCGRPAYALQLSCA